jgi:hypothetical protein
MNRGWYKRRRGILEHLEAGRIDLLDSGIHDFICLKMNALVGNDSLLPPGVWIGSAAAIRALCPRQISERAIQGSLDRLEKLGMIKRWITKGKHGNYPILVCRGTVADLSGNEYRINAEGTTDWRQPKLDPIGERSPAVQNAVGDLTPIRELEKEEREKTPSPSEDKTSDQQSTPPSKTNPPSEVGSQLAKLLRDRILGNNPKAKITEHQILTWATDADRMIRLNGRTESEVRGVIEWCQRDSFWLSNILSMGKLRQKFDQLILKMQSEAKRNSGGRQRNGSPGPVLDVGSADPRRQESEKSKTTYAALEKQARGPVQ